MSGRLYRVPINWRNITISLIIAGNESAAQRAGSMSANAC